MAENRGVKRETKSKASVIDQNINIFISRWQSINRFKNGFFIADVKAKAQNVSLWKACFEGI